MWKGNQYRIRRNPRFFRVSLCHESLVNYYYSNSLMLENDFSLTDIDNMIPWEKKIYIEILVQKIKDRIEASQTGNK